MNDVFKHWESGVAGRCGISRDTIRELRSLHLVEHTDWEKIAGRVCLSDAGVEKIAAALRLSVPPGDDLTVAESLGGWPEKIAPEPITLHVWRQTKNPKIIEAFKPGENPQLRQNILRVRVKNAVNFIRTGGDGKPMALPAAHVQADLYELVGPCPRRKGRW